MEAAPRTSTAPPEREVMTWEHLGEAARSLAEAVVGSGYDPDIVLAIARGGLLPGGAVAYALGVKNSCAMNVEFYTDVDQRLEVPLILPPAPELIDLGDSRMLIVDDVADTGRTLEVVQAFCAGKVAEVRTAVLYEKSQSVVKCDYVWRRTDQWIDFPWSAQGPVAGGGSAVA
jgi:hypoxanthine phosphoribosyltransferase